MSVSAGSTSAVLMEEAPVCNGAMSPAAVFVKEEREWDDDQPLMLPTGVLNEADGNGAMTPGAVLNEEANCNGAVSPAAASVKEDWNSDQILMLPTGVLNEADCNGATSPEAVLNEEADCNGKMSPAAVRMTEERQWNEAQILMLPTRVLNKEVDCSDAILPTAVRVKEEREWNDQILILPARVINEGEDCNDAILPTEVLKEADGNTAILTTAVTVKKERDWDDDQMLMLPTGVINEVENCNDAILPTEVFNEEADGNPAILLTAVTVKKEQEWNDDQMSMLPTGVINEVEDCNDVILPTEVLNEAAGNTAVLATAVTVKEEREWNDDQMLMLPTEVLKEADGNTAVLATAVTVKEERVWDSDQMLTLPTGDMNEEADCNDAILPTEVLKVADGNTAVLATAVTVKKEQEWNDDQMSTLPTGVINDGEDFNDAILPTEVLNEAAGNTAIVKEEPACEDASDSATAELFADHEVKQELVLGPVTLQKQDIAYAPSYLKLDQDNITQVRSVARVALNQLKLKEYSCSNCTKKFDSRFSLLNHHLLVHKKKKIYYECDICKKEYLHKSALDKHVKTHANTGKSMKCKVCGRQFYAQRTFLRHKQIGSECWFQGV